MPANVPFHQPITPPEDLNIIRPRSSEQISPSLNVAMADISCARPTGSPQLVSATEALVMHHINKQTLNPSSSATATKNPDTPALAEITQNIPPPPIAPTKSNGRQAMSPEPVSAADALEMRRRVEEICNMGSARRNGTANSITLSAVEEELANMVLRLTDTPPIDPAQLSRQADTIASLTAERAYAAREMEAERERWRAERGVWDRTAEALLTQRAKPQRSEDAGRQREIYEQDMRMIRAKLIDTQKKLSAYEAELQRLRPLLLMQQAPKSGRHGSDARSKHRTSDFKGKGRETEPQRRETESQPVAGPSRTQGTVTEPTEGSAAQNGSKGKSPPSTDPNAAPKRPKSRRRMMPLSSDAFAEHFLLAAKRIGRVRATQLSGVQHFAEMEKYALTRDQQRAQDMRDQARLEQERLDRLAAGTSGLAYYRSTAEGVPQRVPAAPHTPKKQIHYGPSANTTPIVFVHTLSPPTPALKSHNAQPAPANFASTYVGSPLAATSHTVAAQSQMSNPPTPLDSLLDAARMMDDNSDAKHRRANVRSRDLEEPESPIPKRRRVSSEGAGGSSGRPQNGTTAGDREGSSNGVSAMRGQPLSRDRVRSALDVLADQAAAAFNEPDQTDRRALAAASKGKAQEQDAAFQEPTFIQVDPSSLATTSTSTSTSTRGRARPRAAPKRGPPNPQSAHPSSSSIQNDSAAVSQSSKSTSGRPQRAAARRRTTHSPEISLSHEPTAASNGPAPARSRRSVARNEVRVISPAQPRVIAHAPRYTPDVREARTLRNGQGPRGDGDDGAGMTHHVAHDEQLNDARRPAANGRSHERHHDADVDMLGPKADAIAETEADVDEEKDAEGEQEDELESEPTDAPPRSRSPPPPPPPDCSGGPARGNGDHDPGADADADAEGEMDLDEGERGAQGSSSGRQRATLSTGANGAHTLALREHRRPGAPSRALGDNAAAPRALSLSRPAADIVGAIAKPFSLWWAMSIDNRDKWGSHVGRLATIEATPSLAVPDGPPCAARASSWGSAPHLPSGMPIYHASHCEPPYRPFVPLIIPILAGV